jgi:hypothetical protein
VSAWRYFELARFGLEMPGFGFELANEVLEMGPSYLQRHAVSNTVGLNIRPLELQRV